MPLFDIYCKNCGYCMEWLDIHTPSDPIPNCEICGGSMDKTFSPASMTYQLNFPGGGTRRIKRSTPPTRLIVDGNKPGEHYRDPNDFKFSNKKLYSIPKESKK